MSLGNKGVHAHTMWVIWHERIPKVGDAPGLASNSGKVRLLAAGGFNTQPIVSVEDVSCGLSRERIRTKPVGPPDPFEGGNRKD
ncbi:hypothetical protein GCM10019059_42430 [Camelimonas fluminis]|nr:hypothetical protein GCM10019059_42430 [Camelimonas fluminis]